jgi:hypothetical protein
MLRFFWFFVKLLPLLLGRRGEPNINIIDLTPEKALTPHLSTNGLLRLARYNSEINKHIPSCDPNFSWWSVITHWPIFGALVLVVYNPIILDLIQVYFNTLLFDASSFQEVEVPVGVLEDRVDVLFEDSDGFSFASYLFILSIVVVSFLVQ